MCVFMVSCYTLIYNSYVIGKFLRLQITSLIYGELKLITAEQLLAKFLFIYYFDEGVCFHFWPS